MNYETIKDFIRTLSLSKLLPAVIILVVGFLIAKILIKLFSRMLSHSRLEKSMHTFLNILFKVLIYAIVILLTAGSLGINTSSLVALLSVLTLAISLAIQGTLSNVAGGVQVLSAQPFHVDDFVEIGAHLGTVKEIGPMYTTILTPDGKTVHIPNSVVASSVVINYTTLGRRRINLKFTASYDSDPDSVMDALKKASNVEKILPKQGVFVRISNYGESAIEYVLRVWVLPEDYWDVYFAVTDQVYRQFKEAGVVMTYPHLNVHLDQ